MGVQRTPHTNKFECTYKTTFPQTARSGYLFSCLITCLHGYKIGHEKRINKVLHPCVDTLPFGNFGTAGTNKKHVEQLKFYSYGNYVKNNI